MIPRNSELIKLAPPTKNPSTSFCLANSSQFDFFTEPEISTSFHLHFRTNFILYRNRSKLIEKERERKDKEKRTSINDSTWRCFSGDIFSEPFTKKRMSFLSLWRGGHSVGSYRPNLTLAFQIISTQTNRQTDRHRCKHIQKSERTLTFSQSLLITSKKKKKINFNSKCKQMIWEVTYGFISNNNFCPVFNLSWRRTKIY
jgi:trehalose-6-phosphate synthase